ncbi:transcriptional regulator, partial [Alphaproteobacteria bacterium]|nr:transcriptional regulator [Alphaproteobacteria bacterium]
SASRLFEIGEILDVPISYFFEEAAQYSISSGNNTPEQKAALQAGIGQDPFTKRETLELVRAYYKINDPAIRRRLYALVKTLAAEEDFEEDELLAS